jgi:hypothetical protein
MERQAFATLNRITMGIVVLSLAIAGWIAYQHLEHNAPAPAPTASHAS